MHTDKRQEIRFIPVRDVFAALGRGITRVGKIRDISRGGSSFEYIVHADIIQKTAYEIDIFIPGEEFYLADLPCIIVYDNAINRDNSFTAPFIPKRCGVQFGSLSAPQRQMLENFIAAFTRQPLSRKTQRLRTGFTAHPSL